MQIVDCTDEKCPLPLLKLKIALASKPEGGVIHLITTDPVSLKDIPAFCEHMGHEFVIHAKYNVHEFVIKQKVLQTINLSFSKTASA